MSTPNRSLDELIEDAKRYMSTNPKDDKSFIYRKEFAKIVNDGAKIINLNIKEIGGNLIHLAKYKNIIFTCATKEIFNYQENEKGVPVIS